MIFGNMAVFARSLHLGRFAFAALFLLSFFVSGAWGVCWENNRNNGYYSSLGNFVTCYSGPCDPSCSQVASYCTGQGCPSVYQVNSTFYATLPTAYPGASACDAGGNTCQQMSIRGCFYSIGCSTQCEADSIQCINSGKEWIPGTGGECGTCNDCDEQCQCEEQPGMIWNGTECVEDSSLCAEDRATCVSAGGTFSGSTNTGCCISTCDLCNTSTINRVVNLKQAQCCNQGLAPPDSMRSCYTLPNTECGMGTSVFNTMSSGEYECQDPNLDAQVKQRYFDKCFEPASSSSGEPGSSSGGGSSGEEGTSSGGGEYGDCQECPWLDSILDTLTKTKKNTDDIVTCLTTPNLCAGLSIQIPER